MKETVRSVLNISVSRQISFHTFPLALPIPDYFQQLIRARKTVKLDNEMLITARIHKIGISAP